MERLSETPCVVLRDYAHTPDALERALATLRPLTGGRLIVVFGCGGDRDRGKRPLMGRIAAERSDVAIVTSDNPRTEDPGAIIDDIEQGMGGVAHLRIVDRLEAIHTALGQARAGDTMLLAGKGHETYQILGTEKVPFDEREIVRNAVDAMNAGGERGDHAPWAEARRARGAADCAGGGDGSDIHHHLDRHAVHRPEGALFVALAASGSTRTTSCRPPRPPARRPRWCARGHRRCRGCHLLRGAGHAARLRRCWRGPAGPRITGPVVAITGTNGKTSTKEMLAAALGTRYVTYATRANLNNLVGVPLTILEVAGGDRGAGRGGRRQLAG